MTRGGFEALEARILEELENIRRLQQELSQHGLDTPGNPASQPFPPGDSFLLRAIGSVFHDFYVAAENIFEMIAREIDGAIPKDHDWHLALLRQMAVKLPTHRPPVLTKTTLELLNEFRAFRHVFRNVYGFSLSGVKLQALLKLLPDTVSALESDVLTFLTEIRKVNYKDNNEANE